MISTLDEVVDKSCVLVSLICFLCVAARSACVEVHDSTPVVEVLLHYGHAVHHEHFHHVGQVVYDFNNSAIALRRQFGHKSFAIRQVLDLQLAFEALIGRVGADVASGLNALGQRPASFRDAASRYSFFCCKAKYL